MPRGANEPSGAAPVPGRAPATSLTLLERLRDNESEAWRIMVSLYRPLICHWCIRAGVRQDDVEDVAQEVFRVAALSIEKFRRERPGDSFRGWLRGITRNFTLLYFRRQNAQPQASGGTDAFQRLDELADTEARRRRMTLPPSWKASTAAPSSWCAARLRNEPGRLSG